MTLSQRICAATLACTLGLAACSSTDPEPQPIGGDQPPTDPDDGSDSDGPGGDDPGDPEPTATPEDDIAAVWVDFLDVYNQQTATGDTDPTAFDGLAEDPDRFAALAASINDDDRFITLDIEHWTVVDIDGDRATIGDCVIALSHLAVQDPDDADHRTTWWTATAIRDGDDWLIQATNADPTPCVAQELNDQLLTAYNDYREVKNDAWDPPDPDHPRLDDVATGDHLDFLRDFLEQDRQEGVVFREPAPTDNAVVFRLEIGLGVVSDCTQQVPEFGMYDLESDARLDEEIPPVEEGRLDAQSVDFIRADGGWKAEQQNASRDTDCNPGGTDYVVR